MFMHECHDYEVPFARQISKEQYLLRIPRCKGSKYATHKKGQIVQEPDKPED